MLKTLRRVADRRALVLLVLGALPCAPARAQVLAAESFSESFVGAGGLPGLMVQSFEGGGQVIVGVSLGAPKGDAPLDLSAIRVALPEAAGERLCVALSTSDGRYSAKSSHLLSETYADPPRLGLTTKYGQALAAYHESELLVSARQADECLAEAGGIATPAVADPASKSLIVSVNLGHGRPKAWLEKDGAEATGRARCKKDEQSAKSHDCAIDVSGLAPGRYELVVDSGRLDGPSLIERTPLVLP